MRTKHSPNASKSILEAKATEQAYRNALKSIEQSRLAVETLIDSTSKDDYHTLGLLGPVLAELRQAIVTIEQLASQQHTA